jgi:hypothetical protein
MNDTTTENVGWDCKFTCPECYHDHHGYSFEDKMFTCMNDNCNTILVAYMESTPVSVCAIYDEDEHEEFDSLDSS